MIEPGTELADKYRVVRLVGEGGMGAVYEAVHSTVGRRVAVKVLHAQYCRNELALARFEREARAAAATGHEHIVQVLDFGSHRGMPFLVMEFLQGQTLAQRLASDEPLSVEDACRVAGQVLSALASAHAAGIVHRDLKPENIFLLTRSSGRLHAKLVDFGVSKFQRGAEADRSVTEDGTLLGTPAYMSPEQWMGRRDVDHRADLYAVGVLTYEMLTGQYPYDGETRGELFLEVVQGTRAPEPPSAMRPEVPPGLDAAVLRAIERDRTKRFGTAQEFLSALEPYGASGIDVVSALPCEERYDSLAPVRRSDARAATRIDAPSGPAGALDASVDEASTTGPLARTAGARTPRATRRGDTLALAGETPSDSEALAVTVVATPSALRIEPHERTAQRRRRVAGVALFSCGVGLVAVLSLRVVPGLRGGAMPHDGASVRAALAAPSSRGPSAVPSARASAEVVSSAAPSTVGATASPWVTVDLQGATQDLVVRVDGVVHAERPLRLARSNAPARVDVESDGQSQTLQVSLDRDQVLVLGAFSRGSGAPRRPTARRGGVGELPIQRTME